MKTLLIYIACWFGLMVIAILNGTLREKVYGPYLTELSAHQLSTILGILLFGIFTWLISGFWKLPSALLALTIGGVWLFMTILFEFGFGHYVMGQPWAKLLYDYNIIKGRLWIMVLTWISIAPYVCFRIRS